MSEINLKHKAALAVKKLLISNEIGCMKNDSRNEFHKFDYTSYQELYAKLRPVLLKHKVCIDGEILSANETVSVDAKDRQVIRTLLDMQFHVIDAETGYSEVYKWSGADQDTNGKSCGQATTEAEKRFLFKLFKISCKGDEDPDSRGVGAKGKNNNNSNSNEKKIDPQVKSICDDILANFPDEKTKSEYTKFLISINYISSSLYEMSLDKAKKLYSKIDKSIESFGEWQNAKDDGIPF